MCLIIQIPKGKEIDRWIVDSAAMYNPDGAGIMHSGQTEKWVDIKSGTLHQKLNALKDVDRAVHFRWATHGDVTHKNVHPFPIRNGGYLMHNGILGDYTPIGKDIKKDMSDTRVFIRDFVNPMINFYGSVPKARLTDEIGSNAILLMDKVGNINRYGVGWVQHGGCWFSNEYAWDAPGKYWSGFDKSKSGNPLQGEDIWSDWQDDDYGVRTLKPRVRTLENDWQLGHEARLEIIDALTPLAPLLPINDSSVVAYDDWEIADEAIYSKDYLVYDFLYDCSNATLISLYEDCQTTGLIKKVKARV